MGKFPRKADGRRVFSTEFKRATVQRLLTGEKTIAEVSREIDIPWRDPQLWCEQLSHAPGSEHEP